MIHWLNPECAILVHVTLYCLIQLWCEKILLQTREQLLLVEMCINYGTVLYAYIYICT
uniref:Uncharacterized protein n=1 Tax=Rhizophora mucronata TaxID=61149 RepID=A0A2P2KA03_RHIMU